MRKIIGGSVLLALTGCMRVPPPELSGIAVSDIVQRVKCELAYVVGKTGISADYDPSKPFHWLKYWTAKVDLELETTHTGTIAPNLNYLEPTFTFGFTASHKTEAYRNDKISFTVSMMELVEMDARECGEAKERGLLGHLGLDQWVGRALVPVGMRRLNVGYHQPPTGKATTPIFGPGTVTRLTEKAAAALPAEYSGTLAKIKEAEMSTESGRASAVKARDAARIEDIATTYKNAKDAHDHCARAEEALKTAELRLWEVKRKLFPIDATHASHVRALVERIKDASEQIKSVRQAATAAWELLPRDAPLDSISHTVRFTVTANAGMNPNWILAHFRGPGGGSPFLSSQREHVHELVVVLGSPAEPGGKALSDEQARQLWNHQIDKARRRGVLLVPAD